MIFIRKHLIVRGKKLPVMTINQEKDSTIKIESCGSKKRDAPLLEGDGPAPKRLKNTDKEDSPKSNRLGLIGFDLVYGIKEKGNGITERRKSTEKKERRKSKENQIDDPEENVQHNTKAHKKAEDDGKRHIEKLKSL